MKIFYTNFHLGWGGQPLQVLQLAEAMRERGHDVMVFSPQGSELAERARQIKLQVVTCCSFRRGFRPLAVMQDILAMRAKIVQEKPDIIHSHGSQDCWLSLAALLISGAETRLIRTKHNSYSPARHFFNSWLYNRGLNYTIAVAEPIRDDLLAENFVGADKVSVIHAGLQDTFAEQPRASRDAVRAELKIPGSAKVVGLVGRLAPDKGQDTLLKAAPLVLEKISNAHFLLVGTGGDWGRIENMIKELELQQSVTLAGFRDDVAAVTASMDVALLAARACDASSTVIKEAMVLGVPVVATRVGGTANILADGKCGILVNPGDHQDLAQGIISALLDTEQTQERISNAREKVKQYLASGIALQTENVYKRSCELS